MKQDFFSTSLRGVCTLLIPTALSLSVLPALRSQVPLDPQLAALPVAQRITQSPVFKDPIVYAGDQAPDPSESRDLWSAIDVMRQNGPGVGLSALELFVETYPDSGWTPSLRNNLGLHYRTHLVEECACRIDRNENIFADTDVCTMSRCWGTSCSRLVSS